jgi:hypothetical protein
VPALALDAEPTHYASYDATLANLITDYESEAQGPLYGSIRQELLIAATSAIAGAVRLRASYDSISCTRCFSDSDLAVIASTHGQELSDYLGHDVDLVARGVYPLCLTRRMPSLLAYKFSPRKFLPARVT